MMVFQMPSNTVTGDYALFARTTNCNLVFRVV